MFATVAARCYNFEKRVRQLHDKFLAVDFFLLVRAGATYVRSTCWDASELFKQGPYLSTDLFNGSIRCCRLIRNLPETKRQQSSEDDTLGKASSRNFVLLLEPLAEPGKVEMRKKVLTLGKESRVFSLI
jgi:hypothetical protein